MGAVSEFGSHSEAEGVSLVDLSPNWPPKSKPSRPLWYIALQVERKIELEKRIRVPVTAAFLIARRLDKVDDVKARPKDRF